MCFQMNLITIAKDFCPTYFTYSLSTPIFVVGIIPCKFLPTIRTQLLCLFLTTSTFMCGIIKIAPKSFPTIWTQNLFIGLHNWPRCPEGDFRPEAILSTSFGTSRTASHRSVTLYKASESSDLDFWLDSTPFWCKNRFCSFKTEGVTNIFVLLTKNIWWHQARYVGERSSGCECYSWRLIPAHTLQHCTVGAQWASILTK